METSAGSLEARIAQAVAVVDGVGTVALFGSRATNRARPDSDLRPFAKRSRDEFVRESGLHHLAERLLHLACECVN